MTLHYLFCLIIISYLIVMLLLNRGYNKTPTFSCQNLKPKTAFSIVIPFRNEASNLDSLLKSILSIDYPSTHFEVILVNDSSTDNSLGIITKHLNTTSKNKTEIFSIIDANRQSQSPKKDAITTAIKAAKHKWILTTDADCLLPKHWLSTFDEYIKTNDVIAIAGPVRFKGESSFFNRFQILETLSLQAATIGSFGINKPIMCNGANFCYQKEAFKTLNGFEGNDKIASGDDVFLLEKLIAYNAKKAHYLKSKNAIVTTQVTKTINAYLQQRLRWASKSGHYKNWFAKLIGLIVIATNLTIIGLIPSCFFNLIAIKTAVLLFCLKFLMDLLLVFKAARFLNQEKVLTSFILASFIYPFVSTFIVFKLPFTNYKWKGRSFKR